MSKDIVKQFEKHEEILYNSLKNNKMLKIFKNVKKY